MSEDYRKGFKDGFEIGLEEGKKRRELAPAYNPWPTTPPNYTLEKKSHCPKCGIKISNVMIYNCQSINCPTFYKATSSLGAVGSEVSYTTGGEGANGPAGSIFHHPV